MKNFLENQQFYYINDNVDLSLLTSEIDSMTLDYLNKVAIQIGMDANTSISFLESSMDAINSSIESWYASYLLKIDNINNTNELIMMLNISPEDYGYYSMFEIDNELSSNISYSKTDKGILLSSKNEVSVGGI